MLVLLLLTVSANAAQVFTTDKQKIQLAKAYIENIKSNTDFPIQIDRVTTLRRIQLDNHSVSKYIYITKWLELDLSGILQSSNKLKTEEEHRDLQKKLISKIEPVIIERTCKNEILVDLLSTGLRMRNFYKWIDIQQNVTSDHVFYINVDYSTCVENGYIKSEKK